MWYVYFIKNGQKTSHCFYEDKEQAEHFAKLVNGEVVEEQF